MAGKNAFKMLSFGNLLTIAAPAAAVLSNIVVKGSDAGIVSGVLIEAAAASMFFLGFRSIKTGSRLGLAGSVLLIISLIAASVSLLAVLDGDIGMSTGLMVSVMMFFTAQFLIGAAFYKLGLMYGEVLVRIGGMLMVFLPSFGALMNLFGLNRIMARERLEKEIDDDLVD